MEERMTRRRKMTDGMVDLLAEIIDRRGVSAASLSPDDVNRANGLYRRGYVTIVNYANGRHYLQTDEGRQFMEQYNAESV
jgi:predicted transcriptional regulator